MKMSHLFDQQLDDSECAGDRTTAVEAGLVVIGAGQAALQLASSLRERGYASPITLVGSEQHKPYQRPPLSKAILKGSAAPDTLEFRNAEFYSNSKIDLVLGERVNDVVMAPDRSGIVVCDTGRELHFSRLALCTGATPRRLTVEGFESTGVLYLRDLDDALSLRHRLSEVTDVVVVGGGFIGLEVAAVARGQGKAVSIVEAGSKLMGRAVGDETANFFRMAHESMGSAVRLNSGVQRIVADESGAATSVELSDGTVIPCQLVLVGVGALPQQALAEGIGLKCANGVVVDEFSVTSDGRTVAVGDCASLPNPTLGVGSSTVRLRLESVDNAVEQARSAASTIMGHLEPYRSVPWFWSDQGTYKLQIAGLSQGHDSVVVREYVDPTKRSVLYYREGRLIAADAINAPADFMMVKKALSESVSFDPASAKDSTVSLKSLFG